MKDIISHNTDNLDFLVKTGLKFSGKNLSVSDNVFIKVFQAKYKENIVITHEFNNAKPHIGFNFCIAGGTSFALSGGYPTAHATTKKVNNFLMPACNVTQELKLLPDISLVTCYIDTEVFVKLIGDSIEVLDTRLLDSIELCEKCYFESYQWQPIVQSILSQIFSVQMSPLAQRIFLESKVLELVAIVLDIYERGNRTQFSVSKRDVDRIQYAKELLLKDIANPPSLEKLARAAGTNEYTLKKGFKEIFNKPVFKYLQEVRLAKAFELFQATNIQVGEVASIVGYESVSSFNKAFTAFYGIRPGDVKRIPFKTI